MDLIFFYDHILIYHSNFLFLLLFLLFFLGFILFLETLSHLSKREIIKEIKKIYIKRKGSKFVNTTSGILEMFRVINNTLDYVELKIRKVVKKIEKEIFISE